MSAKKKPRGRDLSGSETTGNAAGVVVSCGSALSSSPIGVKCITSAAGSFARFGGIVETDSFLMPSAHERLTGKVAEKHLIHSRHMFIVDEIAYINADKPVKFQRIV